MPTISPKKLLHSKWTRMHPQNKEKHFIIVDVDYDDAGAVCECVIEAVINRRRYHLDWREFNNRGTWQAGWF